VSDHDTAADVTELETLVRAWIADDPDSGDRAELVGLLEDPRPAAAAELADRFSGRLTFGTAGLRGAVGAGPNRMNRAVVRAATAALAGWLRQHQPGADVAGVVIGCDARHRSRSFADEAARVLAGAGLRVHLLTPERPTPLLAFSVPYLGAAAGVMITASHNPAGDNGYKLYLADGGQIVPPSDAEIEAAIEALGPLVDIPLGDLGGPLITRHDEDVIEAYLGAIASRSPAPAGAERLRIAYTPLHGVAGTTFAAALARAGFPAPHIVVAQAQPDPDFPTVAFPNPEEAGALDLALAEARRINADIVIANDPDGDRLAVAVPDASVDGGWRVLSGDQLGGLLGADQLGLTASNADPQQRLLATTIVSSTMLSKLAAAAGVHYAETLTGFKWIVRAHAAFPGSHLVLGYEEALGYSVGEIVRDKDGIGAALAVLGMLLRARSEGSSLLDRWDTLEGRHGVHQTRQLSLRSESPGAVMDRLRATPPRQMAGLPVTETLDLANGSDRLPPSDVLIYRMDGARLVVRPSGTEPKLKAYLEVVGEVVDDDLAEARRRAGETLRRLHDAVASALES
jgi:phosphomannomutase